MGIDVFFAVGCLLFAWRGYRKGAILAVFSLLAVIFGALVALKLSASVTAWLSQRNPDLTRWAPFLAYLLLFLGIALGVRLLAYVLEHSVKMVALGWLNRLMGALMFVFTFCFVFSTFLWFGNKLQLISEKTKTASHFFPLVEPLAPGMFSVIGTVLPFASGIFDDLSTFLDGVNDKFSNDVAADR